MTRVVHPLRVAVPLLAVVGLFASADSAHAGWDNVFQVTCNDCRFKSRSEYTPAPAKQEVHYEQRCYYEPITVMKPERYTEEVPVKVKSYYWDPVTTYTYKSYYDACSGCSQEIAVPRTSYVRKEQCNTVMKYVERIRMVPTEVQRKVCEKQPVVTYYGPITKTYSQPECDSCNLPPAAATPRVDELRQGGGAGERIAPPNIPTTPNSLQKPSTSGYRGPVNARTTSRSPATVRGEIVSNDQITPRPGAKLVFVSTADIAAREYVQADAFGNFDVKLAAGEWYVYLGNGDGKAAFHKKITVGEADAREFKVVSR